MNLDKILKGFTKTVSKLNKYTEAKRAEANTYLNDAHIAENHAADASKEADKAMNIARKIEQLIDGE